MNEKPSDSMVSQPKTLYRSIAILVKDEKIFHSNDSNRSLS